MDKNFDNVDFLLKPAVYAINQILPEYRNAEEEHKKIILLGLMRAKALLKKIDVLGVECIGKSYTKYLEGVSGKKHIMLLTDEELQNYYAAVRVYDAIKRAEKGE